MNKFTIWTALIFLFLNFQFSQGQNVVINEILASNSKSIKDEDGTHQDWIELYNNGANSVNLLGYGLSDDVTSPMKWIFPNVTIGAGQYIIVWASDKNRSVAGSPLHSNFKISADGDNVALSDPSGKIINSVPSVKMQPDISYGRLPNGTGAFTFFASPTPNKVNSSSGYNEVLSAPLFSQDSAFLSDEFTLTLSSPDPGTTIIYTLDGSEPDQNNLSGTSYSYKKSYPELPGQVFGEFFQNTFKTFQYTTPILIKDRTSDPNKLCNISTTWDFEAPYFPDGPIFKGTVVKAKVIKQGAYSSPTITKNYFISPKGKSKFKIPVVSISLNEDEFYDYNKGISVAGVDFDTWRTNNPNDEVNENLGNFNRSGVEHERIANLSYFVEGKEVINQSVGLRIHGDYSRTYPSKSMRIYARSELGNEKLNYPIFSDEPYQSYERVVIRNAGSDFYGTMLKDPLCNELVRSFRMETEAHKQVVVFINGEYWGILAIRERYDNNYFKQVYNIDSNEIELLENEHTAKEGDNIEYKSFFNYVKNNDLSIASNYANVKTRMDTDNFIDYFVSNIYLENDDWPSNNIIYWRKKTSSYQPNAAYGHDGRWRWAYHDVTSTFDDFTVDSMARATTTDPDELSPWSTLLLRKLLENNTFKIEFINRFADLINTSFLPSRINSKIDEMAAVIAPEMSDQYFRWKGPEDDGDWNYHKNKLKNFANQRPEHQRNHIRTKFQIDSNINVTLSVSDLSHGYVRINTIEIKNGTPGIAENPYPWTGVYFHNIPVKLKAVANPGFTFSHWEGHSSSKNADITLTPSMDLSVKAVFVPDVNYEPGQLVYYWLMDDKIENNTPLTSVNSTFEVGADGVVQFQSCLTGYPFSPENPNWRKASMERRNNPTNINYLPQANNNIDYNMNAIRGLQIKEPFKSGSLENTLIFNFSTLGYKNIKLSFSAVNELTAITGIVVEYSVNEGAPVWINSGLASNTLLLSDSYQLFTVDFKNITEANDNHNFKIRLRFSGSNLTIDNGNRVTFNNISLEGVRLQIPFSIVYSSPNIFVKDSPIADLFPEFTGGTSAKFNVSPQLPDGLIFNTKTGKISGIPTTIVSNSVHKIEAENMEDSTDYDISITVNDIAPTALSYPSPNVFTKDAVIESLIPTVSGGAVTSYSVTPELPAGLTLDVSSGVISGTPIAVSTSKVYTVKAQNSGGSATFDMMISVENNLSTAENSLERLEVFPNPFSDIIKVIGADGPISFQLYSLEGKLIRSEVNCGNEIDLQNVAQGIYLLELATGELSTSRKIIKN